MENKKLTELEIKKIKTYFKDMCKNLATENLKYPEWKKYFEMFETAIKANITSLNYLEIASYLSTASVMLLSDKEIEEFNKKAALLKLLLNILNSPDERNKRAGQTIDYIYKDIILTSNNNVIRPNSR